MRVSRLLISTLVFLTLMAAAAGLWSWNLVRSTIGVAAEVAPASVEVALELLVPGFEAPTYVTHAGDGSGRLFVLEQSGRVRVVERDGLVENPFLDISDRVSRSSIEAGLLGLAFHPEYRTNGRFFLYYTAQPDGRSVLGEYRVSGDPRVAGREETVLLEPPNTSGHHFGGQLAFGPDGYLYAALGDAMTPDDYSDTPAQRLDTLAGKVIRIDVDGGDPYAIPPDNPFIGRADALDEIWAYGFKNPWRFSFDRGTGRMFLGEVGNWVGEEIDLVEPGANYGWPFREGRPCRVETIRGRAGCYLGLLGTNYRPPIADYQHLKFDDHGGNSVVGGYVYRGRAYPALAGRYLFGDFIVGRLWSLAETADGAWRRELLLEADLLISSFGETEEGEIVLLDWHGGDLYGLVVPNE